MSARLALGTAQFGMDYGIANSTGRPNLQAVADILEVAQCAGIDLLDTAIAYGDSETVLGRVGMAGWKVITKLPSIPENTRDVAGWMEAQVTASLSRLGIDRLYGLLLHDPNQMHGPRAPAIARALEDFVEQGLAARVGVSIQHPDHDLPAVLAHMEPSLVQSPFNLLDEALVANGWAARLHAMACEVHTRSVFLQGLLLMEKTARPECFGRWSRHWRVWHDWLDRTELYAPDACLRFVRTQVDIDACIVGVDTGRQLQGLLNAGATALPSRPIWPSLPDLDLITPPRWKTL